MAENYVRLSRKNAMSRHRENKHAGRTIVAVKDHYRIVLISENKIYMGDGDLEWERKKSKA